LPSVGILYELVQYLVQNKNNIVNKSYGDIVDKLSTGFHFEQKDIRASVTCLISSGCFAEQDDSQIDDRHYSYACTSIEDSIQLLKKSMERHLVGVLGEIDRTELDILAPKIES